MKNHSCNLHVPFCSIFHSNSVVVATECDWRQVQKLMIYFIEYPEQIEKMGYESYKMAQDKFDAEKVNQRLLNILGL